MKMKQAIGSPMWMLTLLLCGLSVAAAAADKVKLAYKAQAGQVVRYKTVANIELEAGGMKVAMEMTTTDKATFKAVAPDGNLTIEKEGESREMSVNGMKLPDMEDDRETNTTVIRPDGTLVSYTSSDSDAESKKLSVRMYNASTAFFADTPVGVGDKWSKEIKADASTGQEAGKADFEVLAEEKVADVDTFKLKVLYRETSANPAITASGTMWVEKVSGDSIKMDVEVQNLPFGPPGALAKAQVKQERISGAPMGGGKPAEAAKEKTIDDVVKGYDKLPGLFTLYKKKEAGRDKVMMEVKEEQLGRNFFLQATASTGTAQHIIAGDPLADILFRMEQKTDDKIFFVIPNMAFTADPGTPIGRAVKRSFADGYLEAYKIEAKQPDRKSLLIDVSDLFQGDIAQIAKQLSGGGGGLAGLTGGAPGFALDRNKTYLAQVKSFPDNVFVETAYHFSSAGGRQPSFFESGVLADSRSLPVRVNFNLWELKDNGFVPRVADPRVGYFYTEFQDFTDDGADTQMVRYMIRWNLQKLDPNAPLSPPKKPILFWMDNAIPTEYRDAVRNGILMWNKAFERIGFKDAVQVKQMPDNADFDHADMRYNVIRWSPTQNPPYGAVALFRVNPLTGEIVNAGITVDATLTRGGKFELRRWVDPATHFDPPAEHVDPRHFRPTRCQVAHGAETQAWFGMTAMQLLAAPGVKVNEKEYVDTYVSHVVAHEFGHILGLFHNFAASTQFDLTELKDPKKIRERGITGSVMDYVPFNISALKQKDVDYWSRTIGPYDMWAVEYGYSEIPGNTKEQLPRLRSIASRGNEPGHAYQNDFYADSFDPAISRFDLSKEPLDFSARSLQVTRYLLLNLGKQLPKQGDSYWEFTRTFNGLLSYYSQNAASASRYIGAIRLNRNHKGDRMEKPVQAPMDGARQKRALEVLNTYVFAENAFAFPKEYYSRMTPNPFPSLSGAIQSPEFPVLDQVSNTQRAALRRIFSPAVMARVLNNEYKAKDRAQALTLTGMFKSVGNTIWSEAGTGRSVDPLRRRLQRAHLDTMIQMVVSGGGPEEASMLAWDQLRTLKARIAGGKKPADDFTRIHLDESLMRINRALNAQQTIGGTSAPAPNLLQLLLGGSDEKAAPARP